MQILLVGVIVPHQHVPVSPLDQSDWCQFVLEYFEHLALHLQKLIMIVCISCSLYKAIKCRHVYLLKLSCDEECSHSNQLKLILSNQIGSFLKVLVYELDTHVESRATQIELLRDFAKPAKQSQSHVFCKLCLPFKVIISNSISKLHMQHLFEYSTLQLNLLSKQLLSSQFFLDWYCKLLACYQQTFIFSE